MQGSKSERIREMLEEAAPACRAMCTVDPNATFSYELLSGGVWSSDEIPPVTRAVWALRAVIRHRTCMICGIDSAFGEEWEVAKQLFPEWVGFRTERCQPSAEIVEQFNAELARGERQTNRMGRRLDAWDRLNKRKERE